MNRTMNGNHEMYNGGHTYFGTMLPKFNQKSSYFALQNDNWVLVVLDTAYNRGFGGQEGVLDDPQVTWLTSIVKAADHRNLVLFSHHQPLTHLDNNKGGNLLSQLEKHGKSVLPIEDRHRLRREHPARNRDQHDLRSL
jgi:hypothetical protein